MNVFVTLLALVLLATTTAHAAPSPCSLDGRYVGSAALDVGALSQNLFVLDFNPRTDCSQPGDVHALGMILAKGDATPITFDATVPYSVDQDGVLMINFGAGVVLAAQLSHMVGDVANGFAFAAHPSSDATVRFSGVAKRASLFVGEGPGGPQGPAGPPGPTGPAGPTGPIGLTGPIGPAGPKGDQGIQGIAGVAGAKGDTGAQGVKGDKGDPGAKGDPGEDGAPGEQGEQGEQGLPGASGPAGGIVIMGASGNALVPIAGLLTSFIAELTAPVAANQPITLGGLTCTVPLGEALCGPSSGAAQPVPVGTLGPPTGSPILRWAAVVAPAAE